MTKVLFLIDGTLTDTMGIAEIPAEPNENEGITRTRLFVILASGRPYAFIQRFNKLWI
ncbi:MAG: hypothetical protein ACLRQF_09530 [Thomasclavelia ramosa]